MDCAAGFVAHDDAHGGVDGFADAAVLPEVDVAAADADVGDADEDGVWGGEGGDGGVVDGGVVGGVEDDGGVVHGVDGGHGDG